MICWLQRLMVSWSWFNVCRGWDWSMVGGFVESKYIFQTSTMRRFWVSGDGIIIMMGCGRWRQHKNWSSRLMRMMNRGDMMVQSRWVMVRHVMLDDRKVVESMTMDLVVLLVNSMMSPMVGHPVTDVVCGRGDGDVMVSSRYGGGGRLGRVWGGCPQGREEGQARVGRNVVRRRKDVVRAQSGGRWQGVSLILH